MEERPLKSTQSLHKLYLLPKLTFAHASLLLLGAMFIFPFLYYLHAHPRTTFYQEWSAALLGLCATALLLLPRFWQQPKIPRITLLPLGLMVVVWVQFLLDRVTYYDQALLASLYLLWAALLIMLGHHLREQLGMPVVVSVLALCLLLGAELNALFGILQHYRWHTFLDPMVTVKTSAAVYGNLAQPNHYANYIAVGLISLGLVRLHWGWRTWQVALLALPLLFVLVLSGSRSAGLYLTGMLVLAWVCYHRDKSTLPLVTYSALMIAGFILMHLLVQLPFLAGADGSVTTMQRVLDEDVGSGRLRLYLWREAWLIFSQFPFLGAGFAQFSWQHFLLTEQAGDVSIPGLYNNAHNLVMQIAAEMGMAGLLVLLATLLMWLHQARRNRQRNIYHWWALSALMVLGIHSLLEYPLWYTYFLGVAALLLGLMERSFYPLQLRRLGQMLVALMMVFGLMSMSQMWHGYRKIEAVLRQSAASGAAQSRQHMYDEILAVNKLALMVSLAELYRSHMMQVSAENIADKLELNDRVMRATPISPVVYRHAVLLALAGEQAAARIQLQRAIWAYPWDFEFESKKLGKLAQDDPERFAPLLEFALEKYKEQQRAVYSR